MQDLQNQAVTVDVGGGRASFQMVLAMDPLLLDVAAAIERMASQAGLLMMKVLIQRCRAHKKRNIQKYLPKEYHGMLSLKLRMAWGMTGYDPALQELRKVHDWLASINQAAAESLEEGMEETVTINRLGLSP
ncbi:MAG: hypothetical protein A2Y76_05595 [Planctomycetes bacterium RBG_13_60_9]|nr:MAG: hypothetical protein A2Y76_05595 [Planctomycetes bacterium RBG_13_60_9]